MHESDHSAFASAKVKNEWSYTSSPAIRLCGMDKDKFGILGILPKCVCSFSDGISLYVSHDSFVNQQNFLAE